jgi:ABC-type multidrug transport system ATPase subunit
VTLSIAGVSKLLGGRKVLDDVTLDVASGQTIALFGENGAGKSTLLRILAGVMDADAGRATLDGHSLLGHRLAGSTYLGYVPEAADPPPHMTPRELLALVASLKRTGLPDSSLLHRVGIEPYADQIVGSLSLGQRRRTCLAAALVGDVRLLLLDEPTNGLDSAGVRMLADVLDEHSRAGGLSVVATHDETFAETTRARRLRLVAGHLADLH